MTGVFISRISATLIPVYTSDGPANGGIFKDVLTLLTSKTRSARLHWRESAAAEMLFAMTAPLLTDKAMLQSVVEAQVYDMLDGRTSTVKVRCLSKALACVLVHGR